MIPNAHPNGRVEVTANYAADGTESLIAVTNPLASLTVTLPDPKTVGPTEGTLIKDEGGLLTALLTLTVVVTGGGTIDGAASILVAVAFGKTHVYSSGNAWFTR